MLSSSCLAISSSVLRLSLLFNKRLTDAALFSLAQYPALTEINIGGCHSLTDAALQTISSSCHQLQSLNLYWCPQLTDQSLLFVSSSSFVSNLRSLCLSGVRHLTDDSVIPVLRRTPHLINLDLTRVERTTDETLKAAAQYCPHIERLILYAAPQYTDAGMIQVAKKCNRIRDMDLTGVCRITDISIRALSQHNEHKLNYLTLQW